MKRSLLILATSLLVLPSAAAQPPDKAPTPPELIIVQSIAPGQELINLSQLQMVPVKYVKAIVEIVVVNGQQVQVTKHVEEIVHSPVFSIKPWSAKDAKAYDVAGNVLTKEALFERLKAGDAVLWLPAGQKLHPMYQKLFSKDAVVLTPAGGP